MFRYWLSIGILLLCAAQSRAATIFTFSGNFAFDDDIATFIYTVQNPGQVQIYTRSFAAGGFAPIITVFDANGDLVNSNDGSTTNPPPACGGRLTDTNVNLCWDAEVTWGSDADVEYLVVLTQWGNEALGTTIGQGFRETEDIFNTPNYTGAPPHSASGGSFLAPGELQRTPFWQIYFESEEANGLVVVPEPATGLLLFAGAALVVWKKNRNQAR